MCQNSPGMATKSLFYPRHKCMFSMTSPTLCSLYQWTLYNCIVMEISAVVATWSPCTLVPVHKVMSVQYISSHLLGPSWICNQILLTTVQIGLLLLNDMVGCCGGKTALFMTRVIVCLSIAVSGVGYSQGLCWLWGALWWFSPRHCH